MHVLQEIWVRMAMRGLFKSNVKNAYKGSNLGLRHYRQILYCLSHQGRVCVLVAQSCLTLCDPMDFTHQAPLSMEFSRQEYCSGLPFPFPGELPDPGIKPGSPAL